ncbi:MAG TPA: selenium binding protein [Eubacteriales bacterium]|nr:selenium binding protein [Eubacteriales bacterium]
MYENFTRQSLPTREYRELLGSALCVFNSNNGFIIENIINTNCSADWYELIDKESGLLKGAISKTITSKSGNNKIENLFSEIVDMRNRIIHSFRITSSSGEQMLATKTLIKDGNKQFEITEKYLLDFIKKNEKLCILLHDFRGY